jgi:chemotaxis protein histidine kinase CheA
VDHGIVSPPERAAAGKETAGRIRLSALSESNRVEIYVADDGRGIDAARVGRAAAEREIIADPASVTFDQCLRLIFRPGFSTAGEVSETSGRGIGLEIVDQAMAEAGGEVRVRTESGAGTTFQMILPARLALVSTVLVKARDSFYHIDSRSVLDRGAVGAAASLTNGAIEWHGKPVPRRDLQALLGHEHGDSNSESQSFLIIRCAAIANGSSVKSDAPSTEHIALIVDGIEGEHQALVRGLGRHATRWRGVTGANELRDGSVALVLDVPALLEAASE